MQTKVLFRAMRDKSAEVTALFPAMAGTVGNPNDCTCYARIGQHGAASLDFIRRTRPAKPEEYAPLKAELESIGYVLKVAHRATEADRRARLAQLSR